MQTFLSYKDFERSALSLDKKRCWKQAIEAKQILCTLRSDRLPEDWINSKCYKTQKWINHPAVQMWSGYEALLKHYYNVFLERCLKEFKVNTKLYYLECPMSSGDVGDFISVNLTGKELDHNRLGRRVAPQEWWNRFIPWWLGSEDFHRAMRARLIEKDEKHYLPLFKEDKNFNDGKYLWPDNKTKTFKTI